MNLLAIAISFAVCLLTIICWREKADDPGRTSPIPDFQYNYAYEATVAMGIAHNILSLLILVTYFISNRPQLPELPVVGWWSRQKTEQQDKSNDKQDPDITSTHLQMKFLSFKTFYYIAFFVMSILGTLFYGYFFAFHLLHIAENNQLLKRAIQAITRNGMSLIWVGILFLALFYIYTLLCFAFFRPNFDQSEGEHCDTLAECTLTIIHRGLIEGLHGYFMPSGHENLREWIYKALLDITFFIIITTIGLNIIFGIIVDTFSELRDDKSWIDNEMKSTCFICGRNSYEFEHSGIGFDTHVKKEHNVWSYLFFIMHLKETRPNDYTAIELHVSRLLKRRSYDFFPLNCALSLKHDNEERELKIEALAEHVQYLVSKTKEEEAQREKQLEMKRQQEWAELYKRR